MTERDWNDSHCPKCAKIFEECECKILKITFASGPEYRRAIKFLRTMSCSDLQTKDFALAILKDAGLNEPVAEIEKMSQNEWEDFVCNNLGD